LSNLGHDLARSTIAQILKRHGMEPAPERSRKMTWKEFLSRHWELIVATDFFTVEVWTRWGLERFIVLFFIELSTRKIEIAGNTQVANGFCGAICAQYQKSPAWNVWSSSGRSRCGWPFKISSPTITSNAITKGLANRLISPEPGHIGGVGEVQRRQRLGGMLNYYYRAAAWAAKILDGSRFVGKHKLAGSWRAIRCNAQDLSTDECTALHRAHSEWTNETVQAHIRRFRQHRLASDMRIPTQANKAEEKR
jgi:hypothetical protein